MKIDEIIRPEAIEQVDKLNNKLREALRLQKEIGSSGVTLKIMALTELLKQVSIPTTQKLAIDKLNELIPLL